MPLIEFGGGDKGKVGFGWEIINRIVCRRDVIVGEGDDGTGEELRLVRGGDIDSVSACCICIPVDSTRGSKSDAYHFIVRLVLPPNLAVVDDSPRVEDNVVGLDLETLDVCGEFSG